MKQLVILVSTALLLSACNKDDGSEPVVETAPTACFSANQLRSGNFEFPFIFSNCSEDADSFSWDFGDGSSSTAVNPSHVYDAYGEYTVSLTAIKGDQREVSTVEVAYGYYSVSTFEYQTTAANDASGLGPNCSFNGNLVSVQDVGVSICAANFVNNGVPCSAPNSFHVLSASPDLVVGGQIACTDGQPGSFPTFSYFDYTGNSAFDLDESLVYNNQVFTSSYGGSISVNLTFKLNY